MAFYFPGAFHEKYRRRVFYFAPVRRIEIVKRVDLFPAETKHPHAQEKYFKLNLGGIYRLRRPIPSFRYRRVVHLPSTYGKLMSAREINDLYDTSPLDTIRPWPH